MKTPEQRKAESITFLESKGVPTIDHLPPLDTEDATQIRSPLEVAKRAICLVFVADFAQGHADKEYWRYVKKHSLRRWFTRQEWKFLKSRRPDDQAKVNMSWRIEGAYLLCWAMGHIAELPFPIAPIGPGDVYACMPPFNESPDSFLAAAALRSKSEILDKADLIYRMHWATRQAALADHATPAGPQDDMVAREWHHAVNWLTSYANEDWDDVPTDT